MREDHSKLTGKCGRTETEHNQLRISRKKASKRTLSWTQLLVLELQRLQAEFVEVVPNQTECTAYWAWLLAARVQA